MALSRILRFYHSVSLAEFGFIQIEASCSHQSAICFNIIEEKLDFFFSPLATVLLNVSGF